MEQETELSLLQSLIHLQSLIYSCLNRKEFPFTRTQLFILTALAVDGDLNMKEIARHISSSREQAARAVAPLADAGYVERYTNPQNRTHVYIKLTESGRQFLDFHRLHISEKLSCRLSERLSEAEIQELCTASASINKLLLKVDS